MKYIIMADGKGTRWNNYGNSTKHLCVINGETIIGRTIRILIENNINNIVITSHNPLYEFDGTTRYEPKDNNCEIDRFTYELLDDEVVFLYGDTYYEEDTLNKIVCSKTDDVLFFGNRESIVGIKINNYVKFRDTINYIKNHGYDGNGWTVYETMTNVPLGSKKVTDNFIFVGEENIDIDTPQEYIELKKRTKEGAR